MLFRRPGGAAPATLEAMRRGTAAITCFSFYANKTITTGEGGMAVTNDSSLAERMKLMSLHGFPATRGTGTRGAAGITGSSRPDSNTT